MRKLLIIITIAFAVLCCTDKEGEETMRRKLLEAKAQNVKSLPFTTDSTMKEVVKYYDRHGSPNDRMTAHYLLGCVYRDLGDAPRALQCYNDAVGCADTTRADCDYATMSRIYGQMDDLFSQEMQPLNQLKALELSRRYALKAGDTLMAIVAYNDQNVAYYLLNNVDSVIAISERASKMFKEHGYGNRSAMSLGMIIEKYLERNDTGNAGRCLRIYESESGVFDSLGNIEHGREFFYFEKGLYLLNVNRNDSAELYFRRLLEAGGDDRNCRIAAYRGLSQLYWQKNMPDSSAKYAMMAYKQNDTMCINIMSASLSKIQSLYDYGQYQQTALEKSEEAKTAYIVTLTMIFLSVVVVILLGIGIYLTRKRRSEELRFQKAEYENKISLLKQMQGDMRLIMEENREKLNALMKEKQNAVRRLEEDCLMNSDMARRFRTLTGKAVHPSPDEWREMYKTVDELLPAFKSTLSSGNHVLDDDEYKLCVLVRLHFKPLEISNLTDISQANVTTKRKRLLKKIFGKEGKPKDFDDLVSKIR